MAANDSRKAVHAPPPHRPIDRLFPCLAVVLGETGKFFRNPALHDPKHLNYSKGKLSKLIVGANQEFQDALDEIEIEILEAKAVMERDLASIRTKRAERERVAAGLKLQSPSNGENRDTAINDDTGKTMQTGSGVGLKQNLEQYGSGDVIMTDRQLISGVHEVGMKTGKNQLLVHDGDENSVNQNGSAYVEDALELPRSAEATEAAEEQTKPNTIDGEIITLPEQSSRTPTVPDFEDVNFESMFNDNGTGDDNDQMDFDLGFANDTNTDHDFLNDSTFENINMTNEDVKNLNSTSNEDINTLLPGLESYVNAGDDFSLTDIPASNSAALPNASNMSGTTDPAILGPMEQAPIESNFDDFFASGNYMDGGGDDDTAGDGGFGDFDDSWFGTEADKPDGL